MYYAHGCNHSTVYCYLWKVFELSCDSFLFSKQLMNKEKVCFVLLNCELYGMEHFITKHWDSCKYTVLYIYLTVFILYTIYLFVTWDLCSPFFNCNAIVAIIT